MYKYLNNGELPRANATFGKHEDVNLNVDDLLTSLRSVDDQIEHLMQVRQQLLKMIDYRQHVGQAIEKICLVEDPCGLYYLPLDDQNKNGLIKQLLSIPRVYQGLVIPLDQFIDRSLDTYRAIYTIGLTDANFKRATMVLPLDDPDLMHIPQHKWALRYVVRLTTLDLIKASVFEPVKCYAKDHGLSFTTDVTSIILSVSSEQGYHYDVMFRFIVESNDQTIVKLTYSTD